MAITVTNNNTQRDSYDGAYGGSNIGSGAGGGTADDSYYEGTNSWGRKIGSANADRGFYTTITSIDMTTAANSVVMSKSLLLNNVALNADGLRVRVGSGTGAYYSFVVGDEGTRGDVTYPAKGGWIIRPIDPNLVAWRDITTGSPTLTGITYYGVVGNVSSVSKDLNVFLDASDFSEGLFLVGNTPDGTWEDFISHDEGTNRIGHITTLEGVIYLFGKFVVGRNNAGTTSATTFTVSNRSIVFPGGSVDAGWNLLEYDLTNASTDVNLTAITHTGTGRNDLKVYFDSELEVTGGATDTIDITAHPFKDYEAVVYNNEGGSSIGGLTSGNTYIVGTVTANTFQLFNDRNEVFTSATAISLTPATAGNGQNHSFTRTPSTRPDLTITGTGGAFDADGCSFNQFRTITGTTKATFIGCTFTNHKTMDTAGAVITDCLFDEPLSSAGVTEVTTSGDEVESITGTTFVANTDKHLAGHAIEIDSAPTGNTADFDNLTFTNYGPSVQSFDGSTAVDVDADDRIDITGHPYSDGDPIYYMANDPSTGTAVTAIGGLTTNTLYYVNSISANEITLHRTRDAAVAGSNTISITAGTPGEIHALYSAYAALHNSTTADLTINVLNNGSTPSYRNSSTGTVTVNNAVSITVEGLTEGTAVKVIANETAGTVTSGDTLGQGLANSSGVFSFSIDYEPAFGAGLDCIVRARNQGFPSAAIAEDNDVYTNETTASNSSTIDDMILLPAVPEDPGGSDPIDAYYFGHNEEFGQLKLDLSQLGVGTWTITWQYWNGSTWADLSGVTDGTNGFTSDGTVSWTIPGDWTDTSVNSQGPYKYVRAGVDAFTSITTQPKGRWCKLDTTRYLPFTQNRTITSTGLNVVATWVEDTISIF